MIRASIIYAIIGMILWPFSAIVSVLVFPYIWVKRCKTHYALAKQVGFKTATQLMNQKKNDN